MKGHRLCHPFKLRGEFYEEMDDEPFLASVDIMLKSYASAYLRTLTHCSKSFTSFLKSREDRTLHYKVDSSNPLSLSLSQLSWLLNTYVRSSPLSFFDFSFGHPNLRFTTIGHFPFPPFRSCKIAPFFIRFVTFLPKSS